MSLFEFKSKISSLVYVAYDIKKERVVRTYLYKIKFQNFSSLAKLFENKSYWLQSKN